MLDQYFNKFDKAILPRKFNYPSFSSRFENSNSQFDVPQKNYSASKKNKNANMTESTLKKTNITQTLIDKEKSLRLLCITITKNCQNFMGMLSSKS